MSMRIVSINFADNVLVGARPYKHVKPGSREWRDWTARYSDDGMYIDLVHKSGRKAYRVGAAIAVVELEATELAEDKPQATAGPGRGHKGGKK